MHNKRVIFLGTPDFAVASLKALVEGGVNVVAVVTMPDKPAGRGQKLQQSSVKQYAVAQNIPVLQPERLKNPEFLQILKSYQADLQVVVAFRMLPEVVWNMPALGTFNLHASLLPQYRGAAPINWALINGELETGITTFKLKHEIDTGDLVHQQKVAITPNMNAGELHDLLMEEGAKLMLQTVQEVLAGEVTYIAQTASSSELQHAPKLFKEHCMIDWQQSGGQIHNLVRGLSPYPAAFTRVNGLVLKIYAIRFEAMKQALAVGQGYLENGNWYVAVQDGRMTLLEVQLEGKKRMSTAAFLLGNAALAQLPLG
ncbi:MAG: methionyl-tRNA formyltransferase [Sphingobacteriaceae bacterium]|nr:methionyl-tRNA formyltransferase [Sphingobacteriaceae bacterium]